MIQKVVFTSCLTETVMVSTNDVEIGLMIHSVKFIPPYGIQLSRTTSIKQQSWWKSLQSSQMETTLFFDDMNVQGICSLTEKISTGSLLILVVVNVSG